MSSGFHQFLRRRNTRSGKNGALIESRQKSVISPDELLEMSFRRPEMFRSAHWSIRLFRRREVATAEENQAS